MIVRGIDINKDWQFGKGKNDYKVNLDAIQQNLGTRLRSFLGDCFYDLSHGVDWFNLLGGKDKLGLELAVSATILNTRDILKINTSSVVYNGEDRSILMSYNVSSVYGEIVVTDQVFKVGDIITTEDGDELTTEDGEVIITE